MLSSEGLIEEQEHWMREAQPALNAAVTRAMKSCNVSAWQSHPSRYWIWLQFARTLGCGIESVIVDLVLHYRKATGREGPALGLALSVLTGDKAWETAVDLIGYQPREAIQPRRVSESIDQYRERTALIRASRKGKKTYRGSVGWTGAAVRLARGIEE